MKRVLLFLLAASAACHGKTTRCNELAANVPSPAADAGLATTSVAIRSTHDALSRTALKDPKLDGYRGEFIALSERTQHAADDLAAASADGGVLVDRVRAADALDGVAKDETALVTRINAYCSE